MPIKIGIGNEIHPTVIIYDNVEIGDYNYFGAYCVIGSPPEYKGRLDSQFGVKIGNNNRITEFAVINSGSERITSLGNNNFIMRNFHQGHDVQIGNDNTISPNVIFAGHTTVENDTTLGMGSIIHQNQFIPTGVMLGMNAVITKGIKLEQWHVYAGVPAKKIKFNQIGYDRKHTAKTTA